MASDGGDTEIERAAGHAEARVPIAHEDDTVAHAIDQVLAGSFDAIDAVYVVDADRRFRGAVALSDLFLAARDGPIGAIADPSFPNVGPAADQEHVAAVARAHGATSVAVVDELGRFAGAIGARSLLAILHREHVEDLHRLAGIARESELEHDALEGPPLRRARHRLPWLLVGLAGSMLAALVMARFHRVLEAEVAIAFFIPAIVYLADAIGTQTEAIAVRGLSVSRRPLSTLLGGEVRTGLVIGATLAALSFPLVSLMFGDLRLAFAVAAAVFVAGGVATTTGLLLPWLLARFGTDPAFASGPVATIIQDVLSLLIYFAIVAHVMT